jgi:hypothetical protein
MSMRIAPPPSKLWGWRSRRTATSPAQLARELLKPGEALETARAGLLDGGLAGGTTG